MKNKIVLLFGSFNPVTKAHVETLTKSMDHVNASQGLFIPSSYEYIYSKMIKNKGRIAFSNDLRVKMLQAACEQDSRLSVCTYETDNLVVDNTLLTIEYLINEYPNYSLYFTCGADKLKSLSKWKNIDNIFNNVEVIVFKRSDISIDDIINSDSVLKKYKSKFHIMDNITESLVSSTRVRNLFLTGDSSYKELLPLGVGKFFDKLNPNDYPEIELSEWIKLMHKYGGMHGPDKSLKELYLENKKVLKNFLPKDTIFYKHPTLITEANIYECNITCVNSDIITEYNNLLNSGYNPVIINVCNKERACGKYDMGSYKTITDEEELCRISNLSSYLYPYGKPTLRSVKECVIPHKEVRYPLDSGDVIYCKDVTFFRNTKNNWYKLLNNYINCDLIFTPAISLREKETSILKEDLKYKDDNGNLNLDGKQILKSSIVNAFITALNHQKDSLVITDFGIRSYYLIEEDVLDVFLSVLKEYKKMFKNIIFVLPYKRSNYYKHFYEEFKGE